MNRYQVICLAITDKFGNMHRNQNVSYDENGNVVVEDVILAEDMFDTQSLNEYLKQGAVELIEESVEESEDGDADVEALKKEYLDLSGKEKVPGNWGVKKLTKAIEELKGSVDNG